MAVISTDLDFTSDFVQIPNSWMRDKRLSRRARGLLAELMTHRGGWQTTTQQMVANGPEGRDAVQTALAELAKYGYLRLERIRAEGGRMGGSHYHLQAPPGDGFPGSRSDSGDREPGSPGHWKSATKNTNVQEDQLQEHQGTASRRPKPRFAYPEAFETFWSTYPLRKEKRKAYEAWTKATTEVGEHTVLQGAKAYAHDSKRLSEPRFTKHPTTWLNQGCWDDDYTETRKEKAWNPWS